MAIQAPPSEVPDLLLSEGRYWATTSELEGITGQRNSTLRSSLTDLRRDGRLFSPARGFYVVVPPEYRSWRVIPADWFIDGMMQHLRRQYYVGFLNSAARHGASHQAPQTFTVVASPPPLPDRDIERVRLRFVASHSASDMPTERHTVHTGYVTVATPETTLVDLAWRPKLGGGLSNVATIVREIREPDPEQLARVAQLRPRSTARRLGWLIENYRHDVDLHWLRVIAQPEAGEPALLSPGGRKSGRIDPAWGVRLNATVYPDV